MCCRQRQQLLKPATAVSHSQAWLDSILSEAEYFQAYYGKLDAYSNTIKDKRYEGYSSRQLLANAAAQLSSCF
jgi:hypothetical protein